MKKLSTLALSTAIIAASSYASVANAKTQGHYAGLDLIRTSIHFEERYTDPATPDPIKWPIEHGGSGYGVGLNYKYAFNFNKLFIAPGVFIEENHASAKGRDEWFRAQMKIKNRFGVKADIGYDVTNKIAPYLTGGYSKISYKSTNFVGNDQRSLHSTLGDWFYGAGLKVEYNDKISFNLEYNRQDFAAKNTSATTGDYVSIFKTKLSIIKLGASYNF